MSPAFCSTLRCFDTAGRLNWNGSASSRTVASPWASRARMARRVGSDSAANVALSSSSVGIGVFYPEANYRLAGRLQRLSTDARAAMRRQTPATVGDERGKHAHAKRQQRQDGVAV